MDDFPSGVSRAEAWTAVRPASAKIASSPTAITSARMRRGFSLRCADRRWKASARAFTVSASEDGAQSAARVPPSRCTVSAPSPGRTIMSALMSASGSTPPPSTRMPNFDGSAQSPGSPTSIASMSRATTCESKDAEGSSGPSGLAMTLRAASSDGLALARPAAMIVSANSCAERGAESPDLQIGARGEVDMTIAVAACGVGDQPRSISAHAAGARLHPREPAVA